MEKNLRARKNSLQKCFKTLRDQEALLKTEEPTGQEA